MIARLDDPWFDASFIYEVSVAGSFRHGKTEVIGAQGLMLWCPCGYGKPEYPLGGGKPHAIIIPFLNPVGVAVVPMNFGPTSKRDPSGLRPRWTVSGTNLQDVSLSPSVDVAGGKDGGSCWHGFITNGIVI